MKNNLTNKVVVVTGGCGFIGSFLVNRLLGIGVKKVIIIDNCSYGSRRNLYLDNHKISFNNVSIERITIDELTIMMKGADFLFHLAAEKYNQSKDNPINILNTNVIGTATLIEACLKVGVRKVIFSSSLYAYGRYTLPKMKEDEQPIPQTIYGISKLTGEKILDHYYKKGILYNVLRYFFVYGPKQYAKMGYKSVIIKNFERMILGRAPIIFGDGLQSLDYSYVEDIVDGTISAMILNVDKEIINLGSGVAITVNELTNKMKLIAKYSGNTSYKKADETTGTVRVGDIDKATKILKYKPQVEIDDGLRKTYEWLKNE